MFVCGFAAVTRHTQRLQIRHVEAARIVQPDERLNVIDFAREFHQIPARTLRANHVRRLSDEPIPQPQPPFVVPARLTRSGARVDRTWTHVWTHGHDTRWRRFHRHVVTVATISS